MMSRIKYWTICCLSTVLIILSINQSINAAITIFYPDPPLFWSWSGALTSTTAGGGALTINGDYFLNPGECTISPVVLFTFNDGSTASCDVTYQNPTQMICTVPPGTGTPHVTINICGQLNRDLPRFPTDFLFYVGTPPPINMAWCTRVRSNAQGFQNSNGQEVYICTADTRQKLKALSVGALNQPLFTWVTSNDASKRCTRVQDPNEPGNWANTYFCTEIASPYYFQFVYPCTNFTCQQQCLQLLNPRATSVTFTSGNAYICSTTWPAPFPPGEPWLNYHYAPPTILSVSPTHAPTTGGQTITFVGTSFGFGNVSSIIIGPAGAPCPITFLNHTYATCILPPGQGTSNYVQMTVNGQTSNGLPFTYDPPVIYSVAPQLPDAVGGALVTVTGLNFGTAGTVSIGATGASCFPVVSYNNTMIICSVPPGQGINQSVSVGATGYPANLNTNTGKLTYLPPIVTSVSPSNFETVGSTPVTIVGRSFGTSGVVLVGGQTCSLTGTGYSTSLIQCVLPAGQGANLSVTVTSSSQISNTNVTFSYNPPNITAVTPQGGSGSNLLITIAGTSFGVGATDFSITVDGIPCTPPTGGWAQRRVLCTATNGAGLFLPVLMTVAGQRSNLFNLSYAPVVTSVTSPDGRVPVVGGITLNVTGLGFSVPAVASATVYTGPSVCPVQIQTSTWITCTLPPGGGTVQVTVIVLGMASAPYILDYDAPSLTGLTPRIGPAAGGTVLTLTGINFGATPSVTVGGALATMLTKSDVLLTVRDSGGSGITNAVIVNAGGGLYTSSLNFGYYAPSLISVWPTQGPAVGGYNLTLTGGNFSSAILLTFVVISGASVTPIFQNDTTIIISMPPIRNGLYNIFPSVLVNGQTTTQAVPFQYQGANIVRVMPESGPTVGGIVLRINGTNFGLSGYVLVGLAQATLTGAGYSDTYVECLLPPGQGLSPISITIGTAASQSYPWSYLAPNISVVSPNNAATSGNVFITVTGTDFGTSGVLTMGRYTCVTNVPGSSYSPTRIVCQLPPGQGANLPVYLTVSGLVNVVVPLFSYNPPVISGLSPTNGPTNGGGTLTIFGSNFGLLATSTFVSPALTSGWALYSASWSSIGFVCTPFGLGQSHTQIQCVIPPYQGSAVPVFVNVSGQISNPFDYRYNQPVISSINPLSSPTEGGVSITLTGTNFGTGSNYTLVMNNQDASPTFYNHSMIVFPALPGAGANVPLLLTVADQSALYFGSAFSYRIPVVGSVSGCTDNPPMTESCPTSPSTPVTITIVGSNFFTNPAMIQVTVNALNCTNIVVVTQHTRITCQLPSAPSGGFNLPVVVTVNGLAGSAPLLSYAGPTINANSLRLASSTSSTGLVQLINEPFPVKIFLSGRFWGDQVSQLSVQYGMIGGSKSYACTVDPTTFVPAAAGNNFASQVECSVGVGIGANLTFTVRAGLLESAESADRLSYARPIIIPSTIRSSLAGVRSTSMTGLSSQGDSVFFDVSNVGSLPMSSLLSISYSFNASTLSKSCTQLHLDQVAGVFTISCLTGSGSGSNYSFIVTAGNQVSDRGTDLYSYHQAPAVTRVRGCVDVGSSTTMCPTIGGRQITIEGTSFTQAGLSVTIGSQPCLNVVYRSVTSLTCVIPAGAGASVPVTVTTGVLYSEPTYLFSYANAVLQSISGCSSAFSATIDCPRIGGSTVIVRGTNFGPANATVLIDGGACTIINSSDTSVACTLPSGTQTLRSVILIQNGGTLSIAPSGVYVSYLQCAPGLFAKTDNITCGPCSPGTYSDVTGLTACKNCQPGWYTAATGAVICSQCAAGTFSGALAQGAVGAVSCSNCSAGWYNTGTGSSTCLQCAAGRFNSLPGQMTCSNCDPGYFSGTSGSTQCTACDLGRYSSFSGAISCLDCPIGTIANLTGTGTTSCLDCPAGSVSTTSGQTVCTNCTAGFYAPTSRMGACLSCEPGTFSNDTGLTSCFSCGPGTYSFKLGVAGATQCTKCPKGYYTDAFSQGECLACEPGTYSSSLGATACTQCPSGYFAGAPGSEQCDRCPIGTFSSGNGTITCTDCPVGSFNDQLGVTSCELCALGSVQNLTGMTRCSDCTAGTYMPSLGQAVCLSCDSGFYMNDTNAAVCTRCPPGAYCAKQSGSSIGPKLPVNCSAGYYSAGGAESCQSCDAGQYQPLPGQSSCVRCPAGQSSLLTGAVACRNCDPGTFSDTTGALRCADCPIGHNNTLEGATACSPCPSGYFTPTTGSQMCFQCGAGTYTSLPGQGSCLSCPSGSYSSSSGTSSCTLCEVGTYQATSGSTRCQKCAAGSSQGVAGQVACEKCPAGSYSDQQGSASCKQCSTGTASSVAGVTSCTNCTAGTFSSTSGQLSCLSCPIGTFSALPAASSCNKCLAGSYNSVARATACSSCLVGSYSDVAGSIQCNKCSPGSFTASNGTTSCVPCPYGSYQPLSGNDTCLICPTGQYSNVLNAASCLTCPAGSISAPPESPTHGSSSCMECEAGTYQPTAGGAVCVLCDRGTFTSESGQASCAACAAGTVAPQLGMQNCTACGPGTSQSTPGSASCPACPSGQFSNATAASSCQNCPPGSFTRELGRIQCDLCTPGMYQSLAGEKSCDECEAGSYTNATGSASCIFCAPGSYQPLNGTLSCLACPAGQYQSQSGQSVCLDCPLGTFSSGDGASVCASCPAGSFQNSTGATFCYDCSPGSSQAKNRQTSCDLCAPGTMMPNPAASSCSPCPAGSFTSLNGSLNCTQCDIGKYAPTQGLSACLNCYPGSFQNSLGQSICQNCALGSASNDTARTTVCPLCSEGLYAGVPGMTMCVDCEAGRYGPTPGLSSCLLCSAGRYLNRSGETECNPCPAGFAQSDQGQTYCDSCIPGSYSLGGQAVCTPCDPGTFNTVFNSSEVCNTCGPGKEQQNIGGTTCFDCPPGSASSANAIDTCPLCGPGTYQNVSGETSCLSCGSGEYQDESGATACKLCQPGTYNPGENAKNCSVTLKGYYTSTFGAVQQIPCDPGFFQPGVNSSSCLPCPLGHEQATPGQSSCQPCQPGSFASELNSTTCQGCARGFYEPESGSVMCASCPPGTFTNVLNKQSCDPCAAGTYSDVYNSTICKKCPSGSHQPMTNATSCVVCEPGTFTNTEGAEQCEECDRGSAQANYNSTSCDPCTSGHAQGSKGQAQCDPCSPGSYSNSTSLSSCNLCDPGYFTTAFGAESCDECPEGQAQPEYGSTICNNCTQGRYGNQLHLASCFACAAGFYGDQISATTCAECPQGHAQSDTGQTSCLECSPGYFAGVTGQESCSPCSPGSHSVDYGALICTECLSGQYQGGSGQARCLDCPAGTFHNGSGATQCEECTYGLYQEEIGATGCHECEPGHFKDIIGEGSCLPCWPGEFTTGFGQKACNVCPVGTHSNSVLAIQCDPCERGTANAAVNQSSCASCTPGYYMPNTGQSECLLCPIGTYSANNGSVACLECPIGSYQQIQGQSSCLACPLGQTTGGTGATFCTDCPTGTFGARNGSVSVCAPCHAGTFSVTPGAMVCRDCPAGTYSEEGQTFCTECPELTVSASPGSAMCVLCDRNSLSDLGHTACLCNPGYYLPSTHIPGSSYFTCTSCPFGADCSGYGTTYYNLKALEGFWRASNETLNFYRCPISKYCTGGEAYAPNSALASESLSHTSCLNNRAGIMCTTCELGYHEQAGGSCAACPTGGISWLSVALIAVAIIFLVWLQIYVIIRAGREAITRGLSSEAAADTGPAGFDDDSFDDESDLTTSSSEYETDSDVSESASASSRSASQSRSVTGSVSRSTSAKSKASVSRPSQRASQSRSSKSGNSEASVSRSGSRSADEDENSDTMSSDPEEEEQEEESEYEFSDSEDEEPNNPIERIDPARINFHLRYGPPEKTQDFTYKLKIFLSFFQVATNLGANLNIVWPNTYINFLLFFDIVNFDFALSSVASADCIGSFNYYNKFIAIVLAPLVILAFTVVFYLLPNYLEIGPFRKYTLQERQRGKMNFWRLFLYLLFLVYPAVSSTVLRLYVCRQIDDASFLSADLRVECYTETWTMYTYVSLILILLYPIGIPVFFFSLLRMNQNNLREPRVKAQLGFLYGGYRGECWWFEITENIHKLTLTSILGFLPVGAQLPTGMGICVGYFLILLLVNPYLSSFDDMLALYSECEIFLLVTAGWIFYNNPESATEDDLLLSICLIIITLFFVFAFLFAVLYVLAVVVVKWKSKRKVMFMKKHGEEEKPLEILPPIKPPKREFHFVKEWLEDDEEKEEFSQSLSQSHHSRASLSDGSDWSDDGQLGLDADGQPRGHRRSQIVQPGTSVHPFQMGNDDAPVASGAPKQSVSLAAKADAILAAPQMKVREIESSDDEDDDVVDVFGLDIDDDGTGEPHVAKKKKKRHNDSSSSDDGGHERDDVDDLADLMAPRIRREGEDEDITKHMTNIINARE